MTKIIPIEELIIQEVAQKDDIIDIYRCNKIRRAFENELGRWGACALCLAVCPWRKKMDKNSTFEYNYNAERLRAV